MSAQAKPSLSFDYLRTADHARGSSFVSTSQAGGAGLPLGLYVHVPFCSSTCDFCAFYQEQPKRQSIDLYLDAVAAELAQVRRELAQGESWLWQGEGERLGERQDQPQGERQGERQSQRQGERQGERQDQPQGEGEALTQSEGKRLAQGDADSGKRTFTVFFGGGTPGLLPPADLGRLCGMVRAALGDFGPIVEWTIELAPATVRPERVKVLLEHGVTRFSLGVQSFSDELLEALGRQHSRKQIFAAFETLRANGAQNINCDLMFALPGQTREAWLLDLQTLADLNPEHISTYCLTFEEDTAMWVKLSQGRYKLDPEHEADLYRETWAWLANAGYTQYEVSNFARPGFRSRHNLGTWGMGRWRGVGPSAASQWGGWRFQNPANLEGWANAVLAIERAQSEVSHSLAGSQMLAAAMLPTTQAQSAAPPPHGLPHDHAGASRPSLPPVQTEERVALSHRLLAEDALIFGLRRRDGVDRAQWLARFAGQNGTGVETGVGAQVSVGTQVDVGAQASVGAQTDIRAQAGLPLAAVEALFAQLNEEGLLDTAALASGLWRLNDEGLLLADAIGGQILECFEAV